MIDSTYHHSEEQYNTQNHGHWESPQKQYYATSNHFMLSSQLAGCDTPDSGTLPNYYVQTENEHNAYTWTSSVEGSAPVIETSPYVMSDYHMEDSFAYLNVNGGAGYASESMYYPQAVCVDTTPAIGCGSTASINSLYSIGTGTSTVLRDATCYTEASWAPSVGYMSQQHEHQGWFGTPIQTYYQSSYAAHQPISPQQESSYSSLTPHVAFMIHVESQPHSPRSKAYVPPPSVSPPPPQESTCLSEVTIPLTSRHRKPLAQSTSLPILPLSLALPPPPASSGSVNQDNSTVNRPSHLHHHQPPVQGASYHPHAMHSTKAVKGRHLLPAMPAPAAVLYTRPSNSRSNSAPAEAALIPSMKREADEQPEEDYIRSQPVSRRGSASSVPEAKSNNQGSYIHGHHNRNSSFGSSGSSKGPPMIRPRGTSSAAMAAAAAIQAVTTAHNQNMIMAYAATTTTSAHHRHSLPAVLDIVKGGLKGTSPGSDGATNEGIGGAALTNNITRNVKEPRRPSLACTFCRERKIACGRPPAESEDKTCNQCARRGFYCEYTNDHKKKREAKLAARRRRGVSSGAESESSGSSAPSDV